MEVAEDLLYTEDHLWLQVEGDSATVGVTEYLQEDLEEITVIELPEEGDMLELGDTMATARSLRMLLEIYAPLSGEVLEVNDALQDSPDWLCQSPYEDGWLLRLKITVPAELEDLMSYEDYQDFIEGF